MEVTTLICCIAKLENNYIREWVEWYKGIGATNICLYDNNDIDGETFNEVIDDYIESGFVIIENVRGTEGMQLPCYQHCYDKYKDKYQWIGFFDADEYMEIERGDISDFLSMQEWNNVGAIRLCWKNYDDSNLLKVIDNDYSIKRFTTLVNPDDICNRISKVIVRGGGDIKIYQKPGGAHGQYLNCTTVDCHGNYYDNSGFVLKERIWDTAWLRHYRFKTIDEYLNLKLTRLYPDVDKETAIKWLGIDSFWGYNQKTKEKEEIYNSFILAKKMKMENIKNGDNLTTLICCIGKNENRYVREFVEWYKQLGVTHIRIYDNNDVDGEHFEEVIGDFVESGYVDIVDYRGEKICQLRAYEECYKELGSQYDWVLFIDCDEYLTLMKHKTVGEYLSSECFNDYELIHINWMIFGDNEQVEPIDKPLSERFLQPIPFETKIAYNFPENAHIKTVVRGGLSNVLWSHTSHTPYPNNFKCCDDVGNPVNSQSPFSNISYRGAFLRHYVTKTAYEFCEKMKKGFPDHKISRDDIIHLIETRFFRTNTITKEKINIFKRELDIDMSYLLPSVFEGEKSKDVKIYSLCYSKKKFKFLDDEVITPLQVGAANGTDVCEIKDNTGDNISDKNYFFIENTGIYWIWKNVTDAKYKGQMQYRRPLEGVNSTMNFDDIFSKYDVITCVPFHHPSNKVPTNDNPMFIPADTVEQGYAFSNCADDLYIMEMVVKTIMPEYSESWDKYIKNGPNLYYSNGFIMRSEDYDRYCEFLFKCLNVYLTMAGIDSPDKLRERVIYNMEVGKYPKHMNPQDRSEAAIKWQMSIGGFLSERLWTLWLLHNFNEEQILKLPYIKMEEGMYT